MSEKWMPGYLRAGGDYAPLTVGEIKASFQGLPDDVELAFLGGTLAGNELRFRRFKWRGPKRLQIELTSTSQAAR